MSRLTACLVCLLLISAACSSDGGTADDSSTADDGASSETTVDDASESDEEVLVDGVYYLDAITLLIDPGRCVHHSDLFVVPRPEADALEFDGALPVDFDSLVDLFAPGLEQEAEVFSGAFRVFRIDDPAGIDVLAVVETLRLDGIEAAPVLAWGYNTHWAFLPADEATKFTPLNVTPPESPTAAIPVAVLDTGMAAATRDSNEIEAELPDLPPYIAEFVEPADPKFDFETIEFFNDPADQYRGHGTFIASLLRLQNPDVVPTMYRIAGSTAETLSSGDEDITLDGAGSAAIPNHDDGFISDEFQVYGALQRASRSQTKFSGLNLSGGTYPCSGLTRIEVPTDGEEPAFLPEASIIRAGLDEFMLAHPSAVVAAAAGNDAEPDAPVDAMIPASYPDVVGVGATDANDDAAKFSNTVDLASGNVTAPGVDVVGIRFDDNYYQWSGTSFATPIWLAHHLGLKVTPTVLTAADSNVEQAPPTTTTTVDAGDSEPSD